MAEGLPPKLSTLLAASDPVARDRAWCAFLESYSKVLLHAAHSTSRSYDEAMDRYTFILDQLRDDDFRRLRTFVADRRGRFTTWLVVVGRRLCTDHYRRQYGRTPPPGFETDTQAAVRRARKHLTNSVTGQLSLERVCDEASPSPEAEVLAHERQEALGGALSTLDPRDQLLIALRFSDGLPVGEIAALMGYSTRFQVHRRLKMLLATLRSTLEERGITEP
jgi:RNA polymerase sigma factor (sigma-70 family)